MSFLVEYLSFARKLSLIVWAHRIFMAYLPLSINWLSFDYLCSQDIIDSCTSELEEVTNHDEMLLAESQLQVQCDISL